MIHKLKKPSLWELFSKIGLRFLFRVDSMRGTLLELSKESNQSMRNHRIIKSTLQELDHYVRNVGEKINEIQKKDQYYRRRGSSRILSAYDDTAGNKIDESPEYVRSDHEGSHHLKMPAGTAFTSRQDDINGRFLRQPSKDRTACLPKANWGIVKQKTIEGVSNF